MQAISTTLGVEVAGFGVGVVCLTEEVLVAFAGTVTLTGGPIGFVDVVVGATALVVVAGFGAAGFTGGAITFFKLAGQTCVRPSTWQVHSLMKTS